jgi:hypothetical protein
VVPIALGVPTGGVPVEDGALVVGATAVPPDDGVIVGVGPALSTGGGLTMASVPMAVGTVPTGAVAEGSVTI